VRAVAAPAWTRRQLLGGALASAAAAAKPERRPNLVFLMADDQGWGDVGYRGHQVLQTPHLDRLATQGVRFDRFYAASPVCSPTRGSCLTGRHPFRYGIYFANAGGPRDPSEYTLPDAEITIAELVRPLGYRTGHFGKWHLGDFAGPRKSSPADAGFSDWFSTVRKVPTVDPPASEYWENGRPVTRPLSGDDSRLIMDRALAFIESAVRARRPFLSVIWFHTPHLPVLATPEFRARYRTRAAAEQHYWGALTALDAQVGRLREALRRWGVRRDTMLWYTSDNGPEGDAWGPAWPGSAGPWRGRKASLFEGGIRVPGLLEWPARFPQPRTVAAACSTSDYFPTVCDALGLPPPDARPIDGVSLLPLIASGAAARPRPLAFETTRLTRGSPRLAWIEDRWKLLSNLNEEEDLLFDLIQDPAETRNLAAAYPEESRRMRALLAAWRESCRRSAAGHDYPETR